MRQLELAAAWVTRYRSLAASLCSHPGGQSDATTRNSSLTERPSRWDISVIVSPNGSFSEQLDHVDALLQRRRAIVERSSLPVRSVLLVTGLVCDAGFGGIGQGMYL